MTKNNRDTVLVKLTSNKKLRFAILLIASIWNEFSIFGGSAKFDMSWDFFFFYVIPMTFISPIIYGVFSYLITKKSLFPHLLIFAVWWAELIIIYVFGHMIGRNGFSLSLVVELLILALAITGVSLLASAVTRFVVKKRSKSGWKGRE